MKALAKPPASNSFSYPETHWTRLKNSCGGKEQLYTTHYFAWFHQYFHTPYSEKIICHLSVQILFWLECVVRHVDCVIFQLDLQLVLEMKFWATR